MDQQVPDKQETVVEDLTVTDAEADAVKAGPFYLKLEGVDGDVTSFNESQKPLRTQ